MRIWNETLTLETKNKIEVIKLRPQIQAAVTKAGIADGLVVVNALHGNTGVYVNLEDDGFQKDVLAWLEKLAPEGDGYQLAKHESNAGAYLKGILLGQQACLSVEGGKLALGPFQEVFYVDFDGQRPKRVLVKILGE
jgi:secondary thiamine-phosphate synthase enzyme